MVVVKLSRSLVVVVGQVVLVDVHLEFHQGEKKSPVKQNKNRRERKAVRMMSGGGVGGVGGRCRTTTGGGAGGAGA